MMTAIIKASVRRSGVRAGRLMLWRSCYAIFPAARWFHNAFAASLHSLQALVIGAVPAMYLLTWGHDEIYTILWALVFGFATINILSLGARNFEHGRAGLNFGEILAILVVVVSVILLAWEMLYFFGILPIRLEPRG